MYDKVSTSLNFVDNEKEVMKFWEEKKVFEKSIEARQMGGNTTQARPFDVGRNIRNGVHKR